MAQEDFQTLVTDLVRDDDTKISLTQRDMAIASAVVRYSKDRPRIEVEDITPADNWNMDLPAAWENDFSEVVSIETPIGIRPPSFMANGGWQIYQTPAGQTIQFTEAVNTASDVRVTFTIMHQLDGADDTVPLADREAVCCLAAASLCDQLASLYSGDTDSTIQADSVNHQSKAGEFASRARSLRKRYLDELGIDIKRNVSSGVVVTLKNISSEGRPRLTHGRRFH